MSVTTHNTTKTTINLYSSVKQAMDSLVSKKIIKSQTEFINKTLLSTLEEIQKELAIDELRQQMKEIKRVKGKMSSEDALREVRNESLN